MAVDCITPDSENPQYGSVYLVPSPFCSKTSEPWAIPDGEDSDTLRTCNVQDAIVHARDSDPPYDPKTVVRAIVRPAILFSCQEAIDDPDFFDYIVLPIYRYKESPRGRRIRGKTRAGDSLITHNFPRHNDCGLVPGYINFNAIHPVNKNWFTPEFSTLLHELNTIMRPDEDSFSSNPICQLSDEMMLKIRAGFARFLRGS